MAQLNRDGLAFALGRLYLSRGGSESDLNDVTDSADIVAKLYHLLGGNVATPKGTTMAQLVDLLSTTQGGGGGGTREFITVKNRLNNKPIEYTAYVMHGIVDGSVNGLALGAGAVFFVAMEQDADSKNPPSFSIQTGGKIPTSYSAEDGGYLGKTTAIMPVSGSEVVEVIFDRPSM